MKSVQELHVWGRAFAVSCLSLLLCVPALAQPRILLDPPPFPAPINTMTISDVDLLNSTTPKWLFTISMRTADGSSLEAKMSISLSIALATGEIFTDAVRFQTKAPHFWIPGSRTITNLDLNKAIPVDKAVIDDQAKRRLEQTALSSGMVPAGTYTVRVTVEPLPSGIPVSDQFVITISNPSTVDLLGPNDGDQFANPFQVFQWLYDGGQSRISIFERLPGQTSLEETASGVPHLSATVSGTSYQYPTAGVRPLQPGKTYVWFVEGLSGTSGGTQVAIKSVLQSFSIPRQGEATTAAPGLLDELERLLGPRYQSLFDQIRAEGLSATGTLGLNSARISNVDLDRILSYLRANSEVVTNAGLE